MCVAPAPLLPEGNRALPGRSGVVSALLMGSPWCVAAIAPVVAGALADPAHGGTPAESLWWISLAIPAALVTSLWIPTPPGAASEDLR